MFAKLIHPFDWSKDGTNPIRLPAKTVVDGDVAKAALEAGVAREITAQEAGEFGRKFGEVAEQRAFYKEPPLEEVLKVGVEPEKLVEVEVLIGEEPKAEPALKNKAERAAPKNKRR